MPRPIPGKLYLNGERRRHDMATIQIQNSDGKNAGNGISVRAVNLQSKSEQETTTDANGQATFPNSGVRTQIQVRVGKDWQSVGNPIHPFKGHHSLRVT